MRSCQTLFFFYYREGVLLFTPITISPAEIDCCQENIVVKFPASGCYHPHIVIFHSHFSIRMSRFHFCFLSASAILSLFHGDTISNPAFDFKHIK